MSDQPDDTDLWLANEMAALLDLATERELSPTIQIDVLFAMAIGLATWHKLDRAELIRRFEAKTNVAFASKEKTS